MNGRNIDARPQIYRQDELAKRGLGRVERLCVVDDEIRNLVDDGIGQTTRSANQSAFVGSQLQMALALRARQDVEELGIERHGHLIHATGNAIKPFGGGYSVGFA